MSTNILCVKWGDKYSAKYVNNLHEMMRRYYPDDFRFVCYTDDVTGVDCETLKIESDLEGWWLKLELLSLFTTGTNIVFDLDVAVLNRLERLHSVKTRTLSILFSKWKEGFITPRKREQNPTLYNSSIMKWEGEQGLPVWEYFQKNKDYVLFRYEGIDRYLFNEPVDIDLLPSGIAYSYWKGASYKKDSTPEKLRDDYEVCIVNHNPKPHEIDTWIRDYWDVSKTA